jgi:hypothetical protein
MSARRSWEQRAGNEDYVYLEMMPSEWNRPIASDDRFLETTLGFRPPRKATKLKFNSVAYSKFRVLHVFA